MFELDAMGRGGDARAEKLDSVASSLIVGLEAALEASWALRVRSRSWAAASCALRSSTSETSLMSDWGCCGGEGLEAPPFPFWVRARRRAFSCSSSATRLGT